MTEQATNPVGVPGDRRATRPPVLYQRNFWPYFVGNLVSNCGLWSQNLAQALLIYRLTGSTFLVGLANFAQFIGVFALSPWSGMAADRFDRRRLLLATETVAFVVTGLVAVLALADLATPAVVISLALVWGFTIAFASPAQLALIPLLVSKADLPRAVALNSVTFNLARGVGPLGAAFVIDRFGIAAGFGVNSLTYLALIAALLALRPAERTARQSRRARPGDGIRLVRARPHLLPMLMAVAAVSLTADPVNTLTPGFAERTLDVPDVVVGWLVGAFGFGAVVAAITVAGRTSSFSRLPLTLLTCGVGVGLFGVSTSVPFAMASLALAGMGYLATNTAATTVLQLSVDDAQRGQVMALWAICFLGTRPFGSLIDGGIASVWGLRSAALAMTIPAFVAAGLMAWCLRSWPNSGAGLVDGRPQGPVQRD